MKSKVDIYMCTQVKHTTLETLLYGAFNYALGRKTYIVSDTIEALKEHIGDMSVPLQSLISQRIWKAIQAGEAGMDMDVVEWKKLYLAILQQFDPSKRFADVEKTFQGD